MRRFQSPEAGKIKEPQKYPNEQPIENSQSNGFDFKKRERKDKKRQKNTSPHKTLKKYRFHIRILMNFFFHNNRHKSGKNGRKKNRGHAKKIIIGKRKIFRTKNNKNTKRSQSK